MILLIELLCCAFLLLTAMFCLLFARHHWSTTLHLINHDALYPWEFVVRMIWLILALLTGLYHLAFGLMKLWYTITSAGDLLS